MSRPLDEAYFDWLYDQVGSVRIGNPSKTYWKMLELLFFKEFVWIVSNDDNRAEDGRDLRLEFVNEKGIKADRNWMDLGCSMLELLIGLSRRLAFEADGRASDWFWKLINNIGLDQYHDGMHLPKEKINEILDNIIWRNYRPNGHGGLFPLDHAVEDQREVELWYQLSAYLLERVD